MVIKEKILYFAYWGGNKMITLIIPGEPVAKGRPRVTRSGIAYTPEKTQGYENLVKMCYMEQGNKIKLDGMLQLSMLLYFQIPKSASKKLQKQMEAQEVRPTKKPDIDNCLKIVTDALNKLAYDDDSQIVSVRVEKHYSHNPKVILTISNF
jgi:Holliday junction resolvase RusA-like endonuclease